MPSLCCTVLTSMVMFILATPSGAWSAVLQRLASGSTSTTFHQKNSRGLRSTVACRLNRYLFDSSEVIYATADKRKIATVTLSKDDFRTVHAAKTLSLYNGDTVRSGIVSCDDHDGLISDYATIQWQPEGKVKKAEPLRNGKPPGSLKITLTDLVSPSEKGDVPSPVSLILALPRPLQLGRMLPMIAQMGVDKLVLTSARKVPKDYFGSQLFRQPERLTSKLIEGLCQAGDVRLPQVHIVRNLDRFLQDDFDSLFPSREYMRVIAHPQRKDTDPISRIRHAQFPKTSSAKRMVVAVGPEGGWHEPDELDTFQNLGFQQVTMGNRILRSDCAVVSVLSLAHDACFVADSVEVV